MEGNKGLVYGECLRNHGAILGDYITDGCYEFAQDVVGGSLHCTACSCHRNFHRKIILIDDEAPPGGDGATKDGNSGNGGDRRVGDQRGNDIMEPIDVDDIFDAERHDKKTPESLSESDVSGKKPRNRFTEEQTQQMRAFAESLGWKLTNLERESEVSRFCEVMGVSRKVFRCWVHNNKKVYGYGAASAAADGSSSSGS